MFSTIIHQDPALSGLTVVAAERGYVVGLGQAVRQVAQQGLQKALKGLNQVRWVG